MDHRGDGRIRVVIADDTEDVRSLLHYTLVLDGRFDVVGLAADGSEAVIAAAAEQPDAVVLDLAMPVMDGMSAIPRIMAVAPEARIVVLSSFGAREMAKQAVAAGAAAFVEKATFQTLTSVLVDVVRRRPAPAPEHEHEHEHEHESTPALGIVVDRVADASPDPAPPPAAKRRSRRPTLADTTATGLAPLIRQARWVAAAFAILQFFVYSEPPGQSMPFSRFVAGALAAGSLAAVNMVTSRKAVPRLALAADAVIVLGVVAFFSFEGSSSIWTLLIVPVIEAAMVLELPGALLMWATTGLAYTARQVWAVDHYDYPRLHIDSLTYELGVVLLVAVTTGHLARNFARTSEEHRVARAESERRAELLALVARAGRKLAALDHEELLGAVVDSAVELGFEGVELCTFNENGEGWRVAHQRGTPGKTLAPPFDESMPAAARQQQRTVVVDGPGQLGGKWIDMGYTSVVATPIRSGEAVVAALVAGRRADAEVTSSEVECVELLAAQAGVGLANVRMVERVRHQALHDALTGLPNQILFEDRVAQALAHAGRTGTRAGILFVDLDRFKNVNDTLGHDFGNELLRQVGGRLLGVIRSGDTVARMGGDEFTLLLPNLRQDEDASHVAAKVLESLRAPFTVGQHQLFVTASVGIAAYPTDGLRYETLLKHADIAMYRSKGAGGNSAELYASRTSDDASYPRLSLEADLHHALPRHELRVVYQPQLDLTEGGVRGVEALVRWSHPTLGEIGPTEFLPLAEEAGLIGSIDMWVLETACRRAVVWQATKGSERLRLAVNVSPRQLQHPRFADGVLDVLARTGLVPSLLELEVTEGSAVTELGDARVALERLRTAGVRVAIDDFGTGYSILSRLRDFPLDTLKIDSSFIADIRGPGDDAPIVLATIAMARSLGLDVVAEGVEVDAQLGFLRDAGCDLVQGFLFSRPVEADAVIDLIGEEPRVLTR